ncbi:MAG: hypothetical protein WC346_00210 [Methanogenium sp.]|jgi:hypothetical protein
MIKVQLNQKDFSHILNCLAALKAAAINLQKSIPEESAREFSLLLKQNLLSGKFASSYPKLKGWKKGDPNADKFWMWTGRALASIGFFQVNERTWFAGFTNKAVSVVNTAAPGGNEKSSIKSTSVGIKQGTSYRRALIAEAARRYKERAPSAVHTPEHLKHLIGKKVGSGYTTLSEEKK